MASSSVQRRGSGRSANELPPRNGRPDTWSAGTEGGHDGTLRARPRGGRKSEEAVRNRLFTLTRTIRGRKADRGQQRSYFSETESTRNQVDSEKSVLARNWIRTVCPL